MILKKTFDCNRRDKYKFRTSTVKNSAAISSTAPASTATLALDSPAAGFHLRVDNNVSNNFGVGDTVDNSFSIGDIVNSHGVGDTINTFGVDDTVNNFTRISQLVPGDQLK